MVQTFICNFICHSFWSLHLLCNKDFELLMGPDFNSWLLQEHASNDFVPLECRKIGSLPPVTRKWLEEMFVWYALSTNHLCHVSVNIDTAQIIQKPSDDCPSVYLFTFSRAEELLLIWSLICVAAPRICFKRSVSTTLLTHSFAGLISGCLSQLLFMEQKWNFRWETSEIRPSMHTRSMTHDNTIHKSVMSVASCQYFMARGEECDAICYRSSTCMLLSWRRKLRHKTVIKLSLQHYSCLDYQVQQFGNSNVHSHVHCP